MKRFTLIVTMAVMMAMPVMAERVSPETAQKVAKTFLTNNGVKSAQLTDLSKAAGFPNLYIFNADPGFVVMAADDCARPILGYSLTDRFDTDNMPKNMRWWLQQYSDEIQWGIENGIQPDNSTATEWNCLKEGIQTRGQSEVVVSPLIDTRWNQGDPYNMYCPNNSVTGCVATAMAQVMKYWDYPEQGQGNHSYTPEMHPEYGELSVDFSATTYDWNNMTNTYGASSTDVQKQAVATLMYHCGVSVDMNYDPTSSGAAGALVPLSLVNYFKYASSATFLSKDNYTNDQWIALLKLELDERRPVFYVGSYEKIVNNETVTGGHAFVCDGYRTDDYFHFNWGWGGVKDNYFAIGALNPSSGGIGSGSGSYNLYNGIAAWVEPVSNLDAPVISVMASGKSLILSWETINNADSYIIYKNNQKIAINVTGSSYTDNDIVSGNYYEYYVRAVNSDTTSNPSNHATGMSVFRDITPSELTAEINVTNVVLNWTGYEGNQSFELHYATASDNLGWCADKDNPGTYWGQRYPAASMANFAGMEISRISCYFYYASNYTLYAFNGEMVEIDKLCERSYSKANAGMEWIDFNFDTPLQIDCSKDLWIVLYNNDSKALYPALSGYYSGDNNTEGKYIASTLEDLPYTISSSDISWLIKATLTDGTYTYHLYDNGVSVEDDITATSYTVTNPANNTAHQYTVKTNYYGGESAASNMAGITMGTSSLASLEMAANDKMTVTKNSQLTVTGTLGNDNAANLVIEDGAQLIHSNAVKATLKKDITGYGSDPAVKTGWYTIASPVTEDVMPSTENALLSGTYDLFYYDEPNHHWMNHKAGAFNLTHKQGYLYANSTNKTLDFAGEMMATNTANVSKKLDYDCTIESLKGINLVGNPFSRNLVSGDLQLDGTPITTYYTVEGGDEIVSRDLASNPIKPGQGFLVQVGATNKSLVFNPASKDASQPAFVCIEAGNDSFVDRAYVQIGHGNTLRKITINDNVPHVFVQLNHGDYAAANLEAVQGEIPVGFKAVANGTHTLTVSTKGLETDYLHLIDNMTGADIDLLATPNYTFDAKTTDYTSRFRLIFSENDGSSTGTETTNFAYVSNGEIVITDGPSTSSGTYTLQVWDMMGRVIVSHSGHTRCVPTAGIPAGVYVLRLIDGENTMTQKIVIE